MSSEIAKKNVDLNRIFSLLDYNDKKFDQLKKKNLASLAKSDGFFSLKYPLLKEQNWCNIYNFLDLKEYDDRNKYKGKWQNLGKRGTSRAELFEKWKLLCNNKNTKETNFLSKDDELRKKRSPYFEWSPGYSVFFSSDVLKPGYSSGELKSEENLFKKRFLGEF